MNGPSKRRFEDIFANGKRANGKFCRLIALPGSGKIGIATAKKIGCHARRNTIRRRFRAELDKIEFNPATPLDVILIIGTGAADAGITEVREELHSLFERMKERWAGDSEFS